MDLQIGAFGCSFTYGQGVPFKNAWPSLIGAQNYGAPGMGNDYILSTLINAVLTEKLTHVVVMWTNIERITFADEKGEFSVWPRMDPKYLRWHREMLGKYLTVHHDEQWFVQKFQQQVVLAESFLQSRNIEYIMINGLNIDLSTQIAGSRYVNEFNLSKWLNFPSPVIEGMSDDLFLECRHPNEQGHIDIANRIQEHIRHLGWIS